MVTRGRYTVHLLVICPYVFFFIYESILQAAPRYVDGAFQYTTPEAAQGKGMVVS